MVLTCLLPQFSTPVNQLGSLETEIGFERQISMEWTEPTLTEAVEADNFGSSEPILKIRTVLESSRQERSIEYHIAFYRYLNTGIPVPDRYPEFIPKIS